MSLRSKPALHALDAFRTAAAAGFGLRRQDVQAMIPKKRLPAGIIWELRRHGVEMIAVRDGRIVVGWVMKSDIPQDEMHDKRVVRADAPTPMAYVDYHPGIFAKSISQSAPAVLKPIRAKKQAKPANRGPIYSPNGRPLTKAARILGGAVA